ncbi:SERPINB11 [Cordylochernes scorpioides]|uniref:SERPINB11 n=1 Tax=Cordylochernes scorpioides TaxID=51811 RepID=A0ABY6LBK1_9ARAC|nr:SERPINB11 [Cordylochernes scorpioides]
MRQISLAILVLVGTEAVMANSAISFAMRKLAFSTNQLGLDVYRGAGDSRNLAICPFCISSSLAAILLGATGNSALALRQALYLWGLRPHEVHAAYRDLARHLRDHLQAQQTHEPGETSRKTDATLPDKIITYEGMYVQRTVSIHYPYLFYLRRFYNATVHPLDFVLFAEESRQHINAVAERQTEGTISHLLDVTPSSATNFLVLSALFMRGSLDVESVARVRYVQDSYLNCTAVEVPLRGGLLSLLTLQPLDPSGPLDLLETRLSAQRLSDILNSMEIRRAALKIPQIKMEFSYGNLSRTLYHLGLSDLFTPGYAGLFGVSDFGWFHVTNITHRARLDLRSPVEEGPGELNTEDDEEILQDLTQPFLFFVMDNIAGLAVAMGRIFPNSTFSL